MASFHGRTGPAAALLLTLLLPGPGRAADPEISLPDAVRKAVSSSLDLATRRQALAAARGEIGLARSALLPQVNLGARAELLDDDRSGSSSDTSTAVAAGISQILYDEESWAGFDIEKYVYEGQVLEVEAFKLSVIQDAAQAFLELDRAQRELEIQQSNRELTRENIEQARARIAAGWSSEQEVLRWDVQLASNDGAVRGAEVLMLQSRFELNRVRNIAPETPASAAAASVEGYGFVYSRERLAEAVAAPEMDRRMRDYLARVGLQRSPDLAALDTSIHAAERQLVANKRAFWVPTLSFGAGIDHLVTHGSGDDFNETEWGVRGDLSFPLFRGGAKFVGLQQARDVLSALRIERRATALTLEQSIRSALAQASGAYANIGFAQRAKNAAQRNYELVDQSYTLGVSSILDLLDAQAERLDAELAYSGALFTFLEGLVDAERTISFYAFLEAPADEAALLDQLEREIGLGP